MAADGAVPLVDVLPDVDVLPEDLVVVPVHPTVPSIEKNARAHSRTYG